MKKRIISVLCCFLFLLTGCKGGNENKKTKNGDDAPSLSGNISLYMATPDTLHPLYTKQYSNIPVYRLIYDSLVIISDDLSVVPQLAESCTVSNDARRIRFTLKSGVTWHDGAPFTAYDVLYTLELIRNEENPTIYTSSLRCISDVIAEDDLHFTVYLSKPYTRVVNLMDFPIVPKHKQDIDITPCGTGQYKYVSTEPNKSMLLTKNTLWKLGDVPIEENIEVKLADNDTAAFSMLRLGELSAANATAKDVADLGFIDKMSVLKYPTLKYEFLGFNFQNPILSDPYVRKAISAALDRSRIVEDAYFELGSPANSPVPPSSFLYNKDADKVEYTENTCASILAEGGWNDANGDGIVDKSIGGRSYSLVSTMIVNSDNQMRTAAAEMICEQLNQSGMYITIEKLPFEEYISRLQNLSYNMFLGGVNFEQSLDYAFLLSGEAASGGQNYMLYSSPDMDSAIYDTYTAVSADELKKAYLQFQYVFTRDMPVVGLLFQNNAIIYRTAIKGVDSACVSHPFCSLNKWHFNKE